MQPRYDSQPLNGDHLLAPFDCGNPVLNAWLRDHARHAHTMGACKTTVWAADDDEVVAYYGLCGHTIVKDELPAKLGRGNPQLIPGALLARLALDTRLHGRGYGSTLLAEALGKVGDVAEAVGMRFVVVDAIDAKAAEFYRAHGFVDMAGLDRLVLKVSSIPR